MSNTEFIASHYLNYDEAGQIVDIATGQPFDSDQYSRMKYGDRQATTAFAHDLAAAIIADTPEVTEAETAPQILVAYKAVPPACYHLSRYCLDVINEQRVESGLQPGRIGHVYKSRVSATNYATASTSERQAELQGIDFSLEGRPLRDMPVIVLDDIRITGSAEKCMVDLVAPERPRKLTLGYIALFDAAQAALRPGVENDLNSATVSHIRDLTGLIEAEGFDLNIRTLKMILATPADELHEFLEHCPDGLVSDLVRGTVDTGPEFIQAYADGYKALKVTGKSRGL